jgi:hypothetical protein
VVCAQPELALSVAPDSPRWDLQGNAKPAEYQGRKCLLIDGGAAVVKDFEMRDGVIDVDVATPAARGFFGFDIRVPEDGANYEEIYLRQHKSGLPDAMQYTPVLNTGRNWQFFNGPGFTGAVDIPKAEWFHLRLEVTGAQSKLYVKDMEKPALVMDDLKSGTQKGQVALFTLIGEAHAGRALGTAFASDACEHDHEVEHFAVVRRAGAQSGAAADGRGKQRDPVAGSHGGAAGICAALSLSRGAAPAGDVSGRLFETAGAAAGDEGALRADADCFGARAGEKTGARV